MSQDQNREAVTVWIANQAGHPYHKIKERLGEDVEIKPLSLGDINPLRPDRLAWHLARGIATYAKEGDYLLISGTPLVNALALTLWLLRFSSCKLALWDAKAQKYLIATVDRENLENIMQSQMEG